MTTLVRHGKPAPYACDGIVRLHIEVTHRDLWGAIISERCVGCGTVLAVWGVLHEPIMQTDDDGA